MQVPIATHTLRPNRSKPDGRRARLPMSKGRTKKPNPDVPVKDYRHGATRKNIPPAGLAAQGMVREVAKLKFAYDPHRPPVLRSDPTGEADKLPELLETARTRALTADEARLLSEALRNREPWLE